jgi:hypothetical protein
MSNVVSTTAPLSVKPVTLRVRRHRERRREGLCSFTIEISISTPKAETQLQSF